VTTIAYRDGVMASDSQVTVATEEGGSRKFKCEKLYRKGSAIIGTAGESAPGLIFVDWYGTKKKAPSRLLAGEADFTALVLTDAGLFEYDKWCRGEKILEPFYAIGSGCKAALGAMHQGASAVRAVEIACLVDTYSSPDIVSMELQK
jgi:ATP-dependent protease HslVU (ClpYQ) peptidase subunit